MLASQRHLQRIALKVPEGALAADALRRAAGVGARRRAFRGISAAAIGLRFSSSAHLLHVYGVAEGEPRAGIPTVTFAASDVLGVRLYSTGNSVEGAALSDYHAVVTTKAVGADAVPREVCFRISESRRSAVSERSAAPNEWRCVSEPGQERSAWQERLCAKPEARRRLIEWARR
jgi:hypothetical protein